MIELVKKYRPKTLDEVVGQEAAVKLLTAMITRKSIPHALLFSGPSGVGKTTIARIVARELECSDHDFTEVNSADYTGVASIRDIRQVAPLAPLSGPVRVWMLDECHAASSEWQECLLKLLEDPPSHVYIMLCTTLPDKMKDTVLSRCTRVALRVIPDDALTALLVKLIAKTKSEVSLDVVERIVEASVGSARVAVKVLDQVRTLSSTTEQLEAVQSTAMKDQAIEVAHLLINPSTKWPQVAKVLKGLDDDPERVRRLVIAYANAVLLGGGKLATRAFYLIQAFRDNFYDSGKAGLSAACYEVLNQR